MGKRGPAPKPTALKLIEGVKPNRINHDEPTPSSEPLLPPDDLSDDAREVWDYTLAELQVMRLATAADRDALVCYCEAVVNHRRASALLAGSTILIKGLHGGLVRNPALAVQRDSANLIRAFAQEFGLTPSARSDIAVGGRRQDADNPFDPASAAV